MWFSEQMQSIYLVLHYINSIEKMLFLLYPEHVSGCVIFIIKYNIKIGVLIMCEHYCDCALSVTFWKRKKKQTNIGFVKFIRNHMIN